MRYLLIALISMFGAQSFAQVMVVRKASVEYEEFYQLIKREFGDGLQVTELIVTKGTGVEDLIEAVESNKPDLLVLLDNKSVRLAKELYQKKAAFRRIKSIASMGLNLQAELRGEENIAGVGYEAPGYSIITEFRKLVEAPVKNIVVFYRSSAFEQMILDAHKQLAREQIKLISYDLDQVASSERDSFVRKVLLEKSRSIDGLWLISDNILINKNNFVPVWLKLARSVKIPFLCGIKKFSLPKMDFCTFSASPLHEGLAMHLVELGFAILEDGVEPAEIGVEYIVSLEKQVNRNRLEALGLQLKSIPSQSTVTILP